MSVAIKAERDIRSLNLNDYEREVMRTCMALSADVWTGYVDGKIACIWGVAPPSLMSSRAYLWLYVTELVKEHQFVLIRHSQVEIQKLLQMYETITGHCVVGSTRSIRWLKWLGATFGEADGELIPFQIRRKHG
jgi:hypothetical protein